MEVREYPAIPSKQSLPHKSGIQARFGFRLIMTLTVRLAPQLRQQLESYCKKRRLSKSRVVTELLSEHLSALSGRGRTPYQLARDLGLRFTHGFTNITERIGMLDHLARESNGFGFDSVASRLGQARDYVINVTHACSVRLGPHLNRLSTCLARAYRGPPRVATCLPPVGSCAAGT